MKIRPKIRNAALLGALAAVAATAWATNESLSTTTAYESTTPAYAPPASQPVVESPAVTRSDAIVPIESLSPSESVVSPSEASAAPVVERSVPQTRLVTDGVAQPGITVEERRLTVDQRIQADVMDRIAGLQNVSGKIGVVSNDAVVMLTGYTSTAGQAYRVGREARSVIGVRSVDNQIRPRIGGSV